MAAASEVRVYAIKAWMKPLAIPGLLRDNPRAEPFFLATDLEWNPLSELSSRFSHRDFAESALEQYLLRKPSTVVFVKEPKVVSFIVRKKATPENPWSITQDTTNILSPISIRIQSGHRSILAININREQLRQLVQAAKAFLANG